MAVPTDQVTILNAVVARLRDQITEFNETTLFLAVSVEAAEAAQASRNNVWGCVVPLQGTPGDAEFTGAGEHNLVEYTGFTVIVFSTRSLDQAGHAVSLLGEASVGLLRMKRLILKALTNFPLQAGGNHLLVNGMQPIHCDPPRKASGGTVGDLAITFTTDFEWDLS
jgi:hypothetical protein